MGYFNTEQKIVHVTDLPVVKSFDGDQVKPENLMLFENEGKLVFKNEQDTSKVYIYDLETGKH